jgi:hypothetical protein
MNKNCWIYRSGYAEVVHRDNGFLHSYPLRFNPFPNDLPHLSTSENSAAEIPKLILSIATVWKDLAVISLFAS